jgi:SAM-dependent methyltransferase
LSAPQEWFREWFGETYVSLYPHRDEEEAEAAVQLFRRKAELGPGNRVLDLACGAGRHLERLREAGYDATGMDLSAHLLEGAARRPGVAGSLVRGDMRLLPFRDGAFRGLVNFFTSFGYFSSAAEDALVVREMRRVLEPGGSFLLDYLNATWVVANLEPEPEGVVNDKLVRQTRWIEDNQVIKRIEVFPGPGRDQPLTHAQVFHERVRLYELPALADILAGHGLEVRSHFGDYQGGAFGSGSRRLLILGSAR